MQYAQQFSAQKCLVSSCITMIYHFTKSVHFTLDVACSLLALIPQYSWANFITFHSIAFLMNNFSTLVWKLNGTKKTILQLLEKQTVWVWAYWWVEEASDREMLANVRRLLLYHRAQGLMSMILLCPLPFHSAVYLCGVSLALNHKQMRPNDSALCLELFSLYDSVTSYTMFPLYQLRKI